MMKYLLAVIIVSVFMSIPLIFASDRLSYNNCMDRVKLDYISKKGAEHIAAQCKTFVLDKVMTN